ncbi:MAG: hypothetical protein ACK4SJ_10150 [Sphingorhabdus sp.]
MSAILAMLFAMQSAPEPLPEHLDIPFEHSTVICPSQAAAKTMIDDYYRVKPAPNNHTIDIEHFFEGLRATGCAQDAERKGAITIKSVQSRRMVELADGNERMLSYEGIDGAGRTIIGIVDEDSNNAFPRTKLAEWLSVRARDGWLDARSAEAPSIFYRCPGPEQARTAVSAVKGMEKAKEEAFLQKLKASAAQQGCKIATDRYLVTALLDNAGNECGFECYVDLAALEALDRSGMKVGLIFDGTLM